MTIKIAAELEIDSKRGVVYVHEEKTGATLLRICRLLAPIPEPKPGEVMLDVTHMVGANWRGKVEATR